MDLRERGRARQDNRLDLATVEAVGHRTVWKLEKRNQDIEMFVDRCLSPDLRRLNRMPTSEEEAGRLLEAVSVARQEFYSEVKPYEVINFEGNILVTVGITLLLDLLIGAAGTVLSNGNARLGVGDSSAAESVGQTDLQAASNKLRKGMVGGFPAVASPKVTFQSSFGSSEANFTWAEVGTFNAGSGGTMFNRKVQALGTKSSGATWTLTEDITFT